MKCNHFTDIIEQGRQKWPDRPAIRSFRSGGMETVTYGQLYDLVMNRSEELKEDRCVCCGLYGPASIAWIVDFFAAAIAGKRTVLLDPQLPEDAVLRMIQEYRIDRILPDRHDLPTAEPLRDAYGGCVLLFTSGTTSSNKAVVLSQKALSFSAWNGQQMLACNENDTIVSLLPLNHVFGLVCTLLWPLSFGACVGIGRGMRCYTEDLRLYEATILVTVPTLLNYLFATESIPESVHTVLIGAAPCTMETIRAIQSRGIRVSFGYGLSETASGLAISVNGEDPFAMDLCPDTQAVISEDKEVLVSTPCMMEGYWKKPQDTEAVLKNGVLHTGDLGFLDENGRLHIIGRKNDVLVLPNGEKIFCPEWEKQISESLGNEIALVILYDTLTLVAGNGMDEEKVRQAVDQFNLRQPMSRRILNIRVLDEPLPRTETGKIRRWKLEELL